MYAGGMACSSSRNDQTKVWRDSTWLITQLGSVHQLGGWKLDRKAYFVFALTEFLYSNDQRQREDGRSKKTRTFGSTIEYWQDRVDSIKVSWDVA